MYDSLGARVNNECTYMHMFNDCRLIKEKKKSNDQKKVVA